MDKRRIFSFMAVFCGLCGMSAFGNAADVVQKDLGLRNPSSGTELWAAVFQPADASERNKYPIVVFIPGGLGFGSSFARTPAVAEYVEAGFALGLFDPDGRGRSSGSENWNGKIHQDGLHAFLK